MPTATIPVEEITDESIGKQIIKARKILGLSREKFAALANLPTHTIGNMENGSGVTAARIYRVAIGSGQPVRFFYGEEGTTNPKTGQLDFRTRSSGTLRNKHDLSCLIG